MTVFYLVLLLLLLLLFPAGRRSVHLGLELKSQGLLEVDGPDGLILGDLGRLDLAVGHGEEDGLLKDGREFSAGLRFKKSMLMKM